MSMSRLIKIALGLIAAGAVLFIAGSVLGGTGLMINKNFRIVTPEDFETYTYANMDMEAFESIDIDISNAPVTFLPSQNGKYGVEVSYQVSKDDIKVAVEDKKLTIKADSHMYWFLFDLSFINGNKTTKEYVNVYLPQADYEKICVETSNASVSMENTDMYVKEILIETSNGGVSVSGISTDNIKIYTSNGSVAMEEIYFRSDKAEITVDTSNAGIVLDLPETGREDCKIYADTSNAGVYVNDEKVKPDEYSASEGDTILHLETSNGKINILFGLD